MCVMIQPVFARSTHVQSFDHFCTGQWMWTPALPCCGCWQYLLLLQRPCGQAAILLLRQSAFAAPLTMR